jgi:large subunit ribosomal protein L24
MQRIKSGDTVEIIAGRDIGDKGKVVGVIVKENRVVVEGVNIRKRHRRAQQVGGRQVPAQIVEFSAPLHLSNVMLVCPQCSKTVRTGFRFKEDGHKVRWCKSCKQDID